MKKLKLLSIMLIIASLTSSFAGCTDNKTDESSASSESQVSSEVSTDTSREEYSEPEGDPVEYINENVWTDEYGAIHNKTMLSEDFPNYFVDFSSKETMDQFYWINNVEYSYQEEGYVSFKALTFDPFLCLKRPNILSEKMKYLRIVYRSSENTNAELHVSRSDGTMMGQNGAYFIYEIEKTEEFKTLILDISPMCAKDVSFTEFRIDPTIAEGITVDIKYIAGFETLEKAESFDLQKFKVGRINKPGDVEWDTPEYVEQVVSDLDNFDGTLDIKDNGDGTVTISYKNNGSPISYTVPNNVNYTQGGYAATDDLKRYLPDSREVGFYGSNGEFYVGIFYFLWLGEHGDPGVYDINKIIAKYGTAAQSLSCGAWGNVGEWHFWGEPLYGYYHSRDEWIIRKHMELLSNANIDFLYFDIGNGFTYLNNAKLVMKVCHEMNEQGYDAPQIVFFTKAGSEQSVRTYYDEIYQKNYYPDTWFMVDGKPVIIADDKNFNIDDFFTVKISQWPTEADRPDGWPWIDFKWPQGVYQNEEGVGEAISVSVAQHSGNIIFSSSGLYGNESNRGRSTVGITQAESTKPVTADSYKYGYNFQAQWDRVFSCLEESVNDPTKNIKYVLVTGWNEWIAQRQQPGMFEGQEISFIDAFNTEYSRDLEMTRGLYFDNYYLQLISNISELKGTAPVIIQDSRKAINVTGDFDQWDSVKITYTDPKSDCDDRFETGFGNNHYINQTGRNDIVSAKVTSDTKNLYFYVETAEDISMYDTDSAWMQLFINTDGKGSNGWYGYDYIINHEAKSQFTTTVSKVSKSKEANSYNYKTMGEVSYRVKDNKMMIAVPLAMLGIRDYSEINISFKWADSVVKISNMEAFYELGDAAPLGRLNYIYRNY